MARLLPIVALLLVIVGCDSANSNEQDPHGGQASLSVYLLYPDDTPIEQTKLNLYYLPPDSAARMVGRKDAIGGIVSFDGLKPGRYLLEPASVNLGDFDQIGGSAYVPNKEVYLGPGINADTLFIGLTRLTTSSLTKVAVGKSPQGAAFAQRIAYAVQFDLQRIHVGEFYSRVDSIYNWTVRATLSRPGSVTFQVYKLPPSLSWNDPDGSGPSVGSISVDDAMSGELLWDYTTQQVGHSFMDPIKVDVSPRDFFSATNGLAIVALGNELTVAYFLPLDLYVKYSFQGD